MSIRAFSPTLLAKLDQEGTNFRIPEAVVEVNQIGGKKEVMLTSSVAGSKIYYTFDGHVADRTSHLYRGPFQMPVHGEGQEPLKLKYIIVTPSNRESGIYTVDID